MHTTSPTLLQRLREPNQGQAWARFVDLYTPLLLTWARRTGLQPHDAADLAQEVFAVLVRKLPEFRYDPAKKNFRGWLRTVCLNKWRDRQRLRAANGATPARRNWPPSKTRTTASSNSGTASTTLSWSGKP